MREVGGTIFDKDYNHVPLFNRLLRIVLSFSEMSCGNRTDIFRGAGHCAEADDRP